MAWESKEAKQLPAMYMYLGLLVVGGAGVVHVEYNSLLLSPLPLDELLGNYEHSYTEVTHHKEGI